MADLRPLGAHVRVGPQLHPRDLQALAAAGVGSIINNRPDDEEPDQPSSVALEAAARAAGLAYLHAPVRGLPDAATVSSVAERLKDDAARDVETVMFCRSGMRSAALWAMAKRLDGADPEALRAAAAAAGYDLSRAPL